MGEGVISNVIGACTFLLSALIGLAYLGLMTAGFAYFAWFNVDEVKQWRCYGPSNNKDFMPSTTDGPGYHDITTDF